MIIFRYNWAEFAHKVTELLSAVFSRPSHRFKLLVESDLLLGLPSLALLYFNGNPNGFRGGYVVVIAGCRVKYPLKP